ncbi:MAG: DUF438 domain-containing protein [Halobacteriales archaeon]|jgi:DUF438 domain-containing protein
MELGLEIWMLTVGGIELPFDSLSVDMTYIDENVRVHCFDNLENSSFLRSGSIIVRPVQNCHPPESVVRVEGILSAFRSGEDDRARFLIQIDETFVTNEYSALRVGSDRYREILEGTAEVSAIGDLDGEQRLVDWRE